MKPTPKSVVLPALERMKRQPKSQSDELVLDRLIYGVSFELLDQHGKSTRIAPKDVHLDLDQALVVDAPKKA